MWTKSKSIALSSILVKFVMILLTIGAFIIPKISEWYDKISYRESIFWPLTIILYCTLVPAFIAIFSLNKLITNINKDNVFVDQNVKLIRILSWCCFLASLLFGILGFYRFIAFLLCFAAAFFAIILRVIKNVFEKAITIREENDYTI
ncbi:DUF2975 domain-containing protein [Paludicola sp. MB14-C6]|uniref:DUF2975 domain-containing protein n=1 Tax=Paludihabitans sp. MB14-C6 TaxID=3070656 RepID=UPI0027DD3F67|nr:DUF2975 domain-containing protein [Paludicola sp. MB14-C6]WMJ22403.1 DUF2975 domain-containing protein [Paludicola sp. MB14-C6]